MSKKELVKTIALSVAVGACTSICVDIIREARDAIKDPYKKAIIKQKFNKIKSKKNKN